jgi:hypothetical protein
VSGTKAPTDAVTLLILFPAISVWLARVLVP